MQSCEEQVGPAECSDQIEIVRNNEKDRDRPKAVEGGQTRRRENRMRRRRARGAHECWLQREPAASPAQSPTTYRFRCRDFFQSPDKFGAIPARCDALRATAVPPPPRPSDSRSYKPR